MISPASSTMNPPRDQSQTNQNSTLNESATNESPIPWPEIFARHETVLSSHLQMLEEVKGHIADGEALRTVSAMLSKTVQAMNQLKIVRKQTLNKQSSNNPFQSASSPSKRYPETTTPQSTDTEYLTKRKRLRTQNDLEPNIPTDQPDDAYSHAPSHKFDTHLHQAAEYPYDSNETEDISEEVRRRLRIKEEKRRKKENAHPEKRKRDSLISNDGTSAASSRPPKKRARVEDERGSVNGLSGSRPDGGRAKRMKRGR